MERQTRQRQAVLDALSTSGRTLSPPEILALARRQTPALNLSTVYRQVKSLEEDGLVLRVELPGQAARYETRCELVEVDHAGPVDAGRHDHACGHDQGPGAKAADGPGRGSAPVAERADHHHHHFHCVVCDEVVPIHGCPGPMQELAPPGCEVERHDLVLHGRCARCRSAEAAAPALEDVR